MRMKKLAKLAGIGMALCVLLSFWATNAESNDFPSKTIKFLVAFAPGGNMDGNTRMIAKLLPKYLPKQVNVIVKNVVGAESQKGTLEIYRAKPDGYTISAFQMPSQMLDSLIYLEKRVGEGIMNVTWLGVMSTYVNVGYVKSDSPFKTLAELIAFAKKAKGDERIKIGSSGGSGLYNAVIVPYAIDFDSQLVTGYRSSNEVVVGLIRGDVHLINQSIATGLNYVQNGNIRPLYIIGPERVKEYPDTPTLTELGYPELQYCYAGRFIIGPPGMDPKTADIFSDAIMKAINDKDFLQYCKNVGVDAVTPAKNRRQTEAMVQDIYKVWSKYIKLFKK